MKLTNLKLRHFGALVLMFGGVLLATTLGEGEGLRFFLDRLLGPSVLLLLFNK
jgi:hypothetical protein